MTTIGTIAKAVKGTKPAEEITKGVIERSKPAVEEEVAAKLLKETGVVDPVPSGRPSADDITQRNINFDRIEASDDVMRLIDDISQQQDHSFQTTRRGAVSHEQTVKEAENALTLEDLLGRKVGQTFNAPQMTAARSLLVESAERLKKAAQVIRDSDATEADMLAFRQMAAQHYAIQAQVSGATAEAGRALNAFRIQAKSGMLRSDQLQMVLENSGGATGAKRLAELIADAENAAEISKITRETWSASSSDMFLEYWINGLLSSPTTHAVNITSNIAVGLWQVPERLLASGISKVLRSSEGVKAGEAAAQLYGIVHGFRDGLKVAWHAVKTGEARDEALKLEIRRNAITSENLSQILTEGVPGKALGRAGLDPNALRLGGPLAQGVDLLGEVVRLPGRFLTAEDALFKTIGYRMELYARAYRQASSEGLTDDAFANRIRSLIEEPPEDLHLDAINAGRYQTFTKPLGDLGQSVQRAAAAHPAVRIMMPFIRTPTNIVKFVGERSPLAPLSQAIRADIAAGGARRDLALSRMGLGSAVMLLGAEMAASDIITGKGPKDAGLRQALQRTGWQPYSLKIGDKYYSFNRLDPLGMMLGLAADAATISKYGDVESAEEAAAVAVLAVAQNLTSKTYLQGISDLIQVIDDPDRYAEQWIKRMAGTLIPASSLVAQTERQVDPTLRSAYTAMEQIESRIPGLSSELPPRLNLWGDPIVLEGGLGWDMVSPIYVSTKISSPVDEEIIRNEIDLRMPRKSLGQGHFAIQLMPDEYNRYVELSGKPLKEALEKLIKTKEYQDATEGPDGGKALLIQRYVTAYRKEAQAKLRDEFPLLDEELNAKDTERIRALTGEDTPSVGVN